jgi:hypothetical protein
MDVAPGGPPGGLLSLFGGCSLVTPPSAGCGLPAAFTTRRRDDDTTFCTVAPSALSFVHARSATVDTIAV